MAAPLSPFAITVKSAASTPTTNLLKVSINSTLLPFVGLVPVRRLLMTKGASVSRPNARGTAA
jgi:hypothetical protein